MIKTRIERGSQVAFILVGALLFVLAESLVAHDIPDEIVIRAFVKPSGERLQVLVRLPLALLLNMDLPKRGPGYLDFEYLRPALKASADATARDIDFFEEGIRLEPVLAEGRVSLPSDKAFKNYETALAHLRGPPLPVDTELFWDQGFFDARLEYPIQSDQSGFSLEILIAPGLAERIQSFVGFLPPDGSTRAYKLSGDSGLVHLDPRWHQAALSFLTAGFFHILEGFDHLLFLFCLVIPFRRLRPLIVVVTAFTIAHSITLLAAAYDFSPSGVWFPPLIEFLIAGSIFYMALENAIKANLRWRWSIALIFGLVHGFGFSFALREAMQFTGQHLLLSLVSFNVGVELGQLLVLLFLLPALAMLFKKIINEWLGILILSLIVAHTSWHWMIERGETLLQIDWSIVNAENSLEAVSWILAAGFGAAAVWFLMMYKKTSDKRLPTQATHARPIDTE